jgi:hypothetical protein
MPGSSRVLLEPSPPRADESAALAASSARTSSRNCVRRRLCAPRCPRAGAEVSDEALARRRERSSSSRPYVFGERPG